MKHLFTSLLCLFLTQCITTKVSPATGLLKTQKVYIVANSDDLMDEFAPMLAAQVHDMGYPSELVKQPPAGNVCYLTYRANWRWDMAMYLYYFKATLHQGPTIVGTAEYDTHGGGLDLSKFGRTESKARPVMRRLFGAQP